MDSTEGNITPSSGENLDIAVGRILASSLSQAEEMVTKIIDYHDEKSYGRWRNNIVLISDDPDRFKTNDYLLQQGVDDLADEISTQNHLLMSKNPHRFVCSGNDFGWAKIS